MINCEDTIPQCMILTSVWAGLKPKDKTQKFTISNFDRIVIVPKTSYTLKQIEEKGTILIRLDEDTCEWLRSFEKRFGCKFTLIDGACIRAPLETTSLFNCLAVRFLSYRPETRQVNGTFKTETVFVCKLTLSNFDTKSRIARQLQLLSEFFPVEVRYLILQAYLTLL